MGSTNSVQPYCRLATLAMQMMPRTSWIQRSELDGVDAIGRAVAMGTDSRARTRPGLVTRRKSRPSDGMWSAADGGLTQTPNLTLRRKVSPCDGRPHDAAAAVREKSSRAGASMTSRQLDRGAARRCLTRFLPYASIAQVLS